MNKKIGNFFEQYIDKVILGIIGLVCVWLLVTHIIFSPNVISYDDKKFGPGGIDIYISEQAKLLESRLNRKPEPLPPYKRKFDEFAALVDSAISDIDAELYLPQPIHSSVEIGPRSKYDLPVVGEVNEVTVERIRAVAYVPTEAVDSKNTYDKVEHEPNDIDFVTVEAKLDVAGVYERFYENFAGENIRDEWRDPCFAKPIFAAVQLQRQEQLADDGWGDWQVVSRTKIDHHKQMFEVIEKVEELPAGGIKVRLLQFDDIEVMADLLQPEAYQIASAEEEWFPPSLHKQYVKYQRDLKSRQRRQAKEAEKQKREQERERGRSERGRTSEARSRSTGGGGVGGAMTSGGGGGTSSKRRTSTRKRSSRSRRGGKERPERGRDVAKTETTIDFYSEFDGISITEKMDFAGLSEPLIFWAHDDTVEPGRTYRYRIRLGVFNPIAGTNKFSEQYESQKNQVILWSEFSGDTEPVEIPERLYFFPREFQETAGVVTVQICRYVLGYWYSKDFMLKPGEIIGKVVKSEITKEQEKLVLPETVDYATGVVLVDVVPVNDWSGGKNLRPRHYFDMLYSLDGINIKHRSVKMKYWPEELKAVFSEIKKSEREPKEPLRQWGQRPGGRKGLPQQPGPGQRPPSGPGTPGAMF